MSHPFFDPDGRERDLRARLRWFLTEVMGPLSTELRIDYLLRVLKDYHAQWDPIPRPPAPNAPARILVVDDDEDIACFQKQLLESAGYEVESGLDGVAALEAVARRMPDLLIINWLMPRMCGDEAIRRLRQDIRTRELPIILTSVRPTAREIAREVGANDFMGLPFSVKDLYRAVGSLLSRPAKTACQ